MRSEGVSAAGESAATFEGAGGALARPTGRGVIFAILTRASASAVLQGMSLLMGFGTTVLLARFLG